MPHSNSYLYIAVSIAAIVRLGWTFLFPFLLLLLLQIYTASESSYLYNIPSPPEALCNYTQREREKKERIQNESSFFEPVYFTIATQPVDVVPMQYKSRTGTKSPLNND